MNKYYNVPVRDCLFEHDGLNLRDHLWFVAPDMYYKDCAFREFVFGEIFDTSVGSTAYHELLSEHEEEMKKMSEQFRIPYNFILVDDGEKLYEMVTNTEFERDPGDAMIASYEIDAEQAVDLYEENPNYKKQSKNFFNTYSRNKYNLPNITNSEYRSKEIVDVHRHK